jgi:hypothetical protein
MALMAVILISAAGLGQKMVHFKDGTVMEARSKSLGRKMLLKTAFGQRTVSKKEIAETSAVGPVREEYGAMAKGVGDEKIKENQAIAEWCMKRGYLTGLRERLNVILKRDIEDKWAGGIVKKQARLFLAHESEGGTKPRDQRKLYDYLLKVLAPQDPVGAVLAREKMVRIPEGIILRPAIKGMKSRAPGTRWLAAQLLRRFRRTPDRIVPLYRCCLLDNSAMVRKEAVKSLEVTKDEVFVKLFSKNLYNPSQQVRLNAVEALQGFGMKQAVEPLMTALADSGSTTRNNIMRRKHIAYVKDFDVEIAQAAVIADPIVDVATEGGVLDVGVVGVHGERRAIAGALRTLTSADFGTNASAWQEWWAGQKKKQD